MAHITGRKPSSACTVLRCNCHAEDANGCWWMRVWSDLGRLGVPDAFKLDTAPDGMLRVWIAEVNVTHHADEGKWFDLWDLLDCECVWLRVLVVDRNGTVSEPWYDGALARARDLDHYREVFGDAEAVVSVCTPAEWFVGRPAAQAAMNRRSAARGARGPMPRETTATLRERTRANMNRILDAKTPAPRAGRPLDSLLDTGR
ncbi:MAG: hypothetical protein IPK80_02885 [Nannocystis sp.]|nr:hypothetical protein [Nannocystis sp.]